MNTDFETIRVEQANRSKFDAEQVRIKDHNGRWLSGWDAQLLNTVGQEIVVEVKTVHKGDKTYHNIRSFQLAEGQPSQAHSGAPQAPNTLSHVNGAGGASGAPQEPFDSVRSMEILYQTCLKEVCASIGLTLENLDAVSELTVRLAHSVRDTAQEKPQLEMQKQHQAAQAIDDDDIPF